MKNGNYKVYLRIASGTRNKGLNGFLIIFSSDDKNIWIESLGTKYFNNFSINGTSNDKYKPKSTITNYVTI